jgi:hypothetical protein
MRKAAQSPYGQTIAPARSPRIITRNVEVKPVAKTSIKEVSTVQSISEANTPVVNVDVATIQSISEANGPVETVEAATIASISEANGPVENMKVTMVQQISEANAPVENVKDVGGSDRVADDVSEKEGGMQLMDKKEKEDLKSEATADLVGESMPVPAGVDTEMPGEAGQKQNAEVIPSCQVVQFPVSQEIPEKPPSETSGTETESQDTCGSFPTKANEYTTCLQGCVEWMSYYKVYALYVADSKMS